MVRVDDLEQVAQGFGDLLAAFDLAQALLGLGPQPGVFDRQRRLLGERQAQVDLVGAVRVRRAVVQHERAVRLVARDQRHRGDGRVGGGEPQIVLAVLGLIVVGRAGPGPHDLQVGAAIVDLLVDRLDAGLGERRARNRTRPRCAAARRPGR